MNGRGRRGCCQEMLCSEDDEVVLILRLAVSWGKCRREGIRGVHRWLTRRGLAVAFRGRRRGKRPSHDQSSTQLLRGGTAGTFSNIRRSVSALRVSCSIIAVSWRRSCSMSSVIAGSGFSGAVGSATSPPGLHPSIASRELSPTCLVVPQLARVPHESPSSSPSSPSKLDDRRSARP